MSDQSVTSKNKLSNNSSTNNPFAITGMVLGISSILLFIIGVIPILAIIFSGIGLSKVKQYGDRGRAQSWVGLILGILYTLTYLQYYGHLNFK